VDLAKGLETLLFTEFVLVIEEFEAVKDFLHHEETIFRDLVFHI
jgi:hypothetical protein